MPDQNWEDHLRAFSAIRDTRAAMETSTQASEGVIASVIVAYARRETTTANLNIERRLRQSAGARALYAKALGHVAQASSRSVAAAADLVSARRVGAWQIEIVDEPDNGAWLVIHAPEGVDPIKLIELRRPSGEGHRLNLGEPIDQIYQVPLDPRFEELSDLLGWLRDPFTEIHLI